MTKELLRKELSTKCAELNLIERVQAANVILDNGLELLMAANKIAIYHAYKWEVNLRPIIEYCQKFGKKLYQPVAYKETKVMRFMSYNELNNAIFYPADYIPKDELQWYNLDLIFLPLVAVDKNGCRLGKGGGYYDATLVKTPLMAHIPILCGVGFGIQMLDMLPTDKWDVKLNYFLSERGLIKF